ncbi:hypothetical protein [Gelidibacter maritimus]|uniref:Uncharacterized protein n=1 Tax=Gelidibacter maritimus TaxID=2761487 RepID=A0A7W2M4H7_9FLAO|nr:hypothetical protein [Gelidibacter maritimus]MBA6152523.1 hypothetical protein [Gelidibacter maritimus]
MKPLVNYGYETDDEIVKRHRHRELSTWISHLDAMINEADQLAKIIVHKIGDKELRNELLDDVNENIHLLNEFYTYRNLLNNVKECDELECDQFYMRHHDHVFEKYMDCVTQYRVVKNKVYQRLLF